MKSIRPIDHVDQLMARHNLAAAADQVHALLKQAIRLVASPVETTMSTLPGASRLGGAPDIPAAFAWPAWQGIPMAFVAQIWLADLAEFEVADALPRAGLLSFFYDARQETHGALPEDQGGWQVTFFGPDEPFRKARFPAELPSRARFATCSLRFEPEWTLPASPTQAAPDLDWTDGRIKQYEALLYEFHQGRNSAGPHHRMFGWPDQLQDDMQLQAEMLSRGITQMTDPRARQAALDKHHWELLLQVDSDDRTGMRWGSYGMLDYWITGQALKTRMFDKTWLVLQSE